jgi:uncharacterized protein YdeI (YjbR/CyaY-like superfamily)
MRVGRTVANANVAGAMVDAGRPSRRASAMPSTRAEKKKIVPAPDFVSELKTHGAAWDRWCELSDSCQREHVEAIEEAKKPETRARRIDAAVRMILAMPRKKAR